MNLAALHSHCGERFCVCLRWLSVDNSDPIKDQSGVPQNKVQHASAATLERTLVGRHVSCFPTNLQ